MKIAGNKELFKDQQYFYWIMPSAFFGIILTVLVLYATKNGVGINRDTETYFFAARTLNIYSIRPYQAPLYYLILMVFHRMGVCLFTASRYINITCVFLYTLVHGYFISRLISKKRMFLCSMVLMSFNYTLFAIQTVAQTEPLYLLFQSVCVLSLCVYMKRQGQATAFLVCAALSAGAAIATRFIGIVMVFTIGMIVLVTKSNETVWKKVHKAFLACFVAVTPFVFYGLFNMTRSVSVVGDSVNAPVFPVDNIHSALHVIVTAFVPYKLFAVMNENVLMIMLASFIALMTWYAWRNYPNRAIFPAVACALLTAIFTVLSIVYKDAQIRLDLRIASPFILMVYFIYVMILVDSLDKHAKMRYRAMSVILLIIPLMTNVHRIMTVASRLSVQGIGYATDAWRTCQAVKFAVHLSEEIDVYANSTTPALLYHGVRLKTYPLKIFPSNRLPNQNYELQMAAIGEAASEGEAVIFVFRLKHSNDYEFPYYYANVPEMMKLCGIEKIAEVEGGTILGNKVIWERLAWIAEQNGIMIVREGKDI